MPYRSRNDVLVRTLRSLVVTCCTTIVGDFVFPLLWIDISVNRSWRFDRTRCVTAALCWAHSAVIHVQFTRPTWTDSATMIVNISKTKEIVFQRPSLKHFLAPSALCDIEQVSGAKLLGVIFKNNFSFDEQLFLNVVVSVLIYLNYFGTRVCCRCIWILYFIHLLCQRFDMLCVLGGGFLTQIQKGMINAFLRRMYKYHFVSELTKCHRLSTLILLWMTWIRNF